MKPISQFAVALLIGAVAYLLHPSDEEAQKTEASAPLRPTAGSAGPSFALPDASQYPPLAPQRARFFELDRNGELLIDSTTPAKLDVLLSELPERAGWRELQPIEEHVKESLPDAAAQKAVRILNGYIALRKAEATLDMQPRAAGLAGAEAMLNALVALRRAHLGQQVADAMFSLQEAQARFGIQSARIEADAGLSARDKSARIDALQKALPPGAELPDEATQAARAVEEQVVLLRQRGASESEIWQLRQQSRGTEEAQFITEMEAQQLQWERRYHDYLQQKNMILATSQSEQQKQQQIDALLRKHYSDQEIATARAYDRGIGQK